MDRNEFMEKLGELVTDANNDNVGVENIVYALNGCLFSFLRAIVE